MPTFSEIASVIGPAGAVILWIWLNRDKSPPPKDDSGKIDEIHTLLVEIAAIVRQWRR